MIQKWTYKSDDTDSSINGLFDYENSIIIIAGEELQNPYIIQTSLIKMLSFSSVDMSKDLINALSHQFLEHCNKIKALSDLSEGTIQKYAKILRRPKKWKILFTPIDGYNENRPEPLSSITYRSKKTPDRLTDPVTITPQIQILNKQASITDHSKHHKSFEVNISDVDRYSSDKYTATLAMTDTYKGVSIGLNLNSSQLGTASYVEYWHYLSDSPQKADISFEQIKKIIVALAQEIEYNRYPMALVLPMFRNALQDVDVEHKEKSGVDNYNRYLKVVDKAADWRQTIYGPRYPAHNLFV